MGVIFRGFVLGAGSGIRDVLRARICRIDLFPSHSFFLLSLSLSLIHSFISLLGSNPKGMVLSAPVRFLRRRRFVSFRFGFVAAAIAEQGTETKPAYAILLDFNREGSLTLSRDGHTRHHVVVSTDI